MKNEPLIANPYICWVCKKPVGTYTGFWSRIDEIEDDVFHHCSCYLISDIIPSKRKRQCIQEHREKFEKDCPDLLEKMEFMLL